MELLTLVKSTAKLSVCVYMCVMSAAHRMDKNTYTAGETAQIHVEVRNDSAVDIENFAVKVSGRI